MKRNGSGRDWLVIFRSWHRRKLYMGVEQVRDLFVLLIAAISEPSDPVAVQGPDGLRQLTSVSRSSDRQ